MTTTKQYDYQHFDYNFDTIGNRTQTEAGGDQMGLNLRVGNYTNNSLNQITSRDYPGYVDVMGDGLATNPVTVNSVTAYRKNEYFRQQLSVANTSSAVWESITVAAPGQTSVTGYEYVPKTPENYTYDLDGNLLSDGRWNYVWDGENRLVSITSLSGAPSGSQLQLNFTYDYQGRRLQKAVAAWSGSAYTNAYTHNYLYDGWNCIGTFDSSLNLLSSFMWGLDLSGSIQGAGGVGGLIREAYYGASTTNCFVAFDGNGNVSALVNTADGTTLANYEYGPFGEVIRASGTMGKINPVRFSNKYNDDETDLLYYGHRYYNPSTGRWLSRDPIDELSFHHNYVSSLNAKGRYAMFLRPPAGNEYCYLNNDSEDHFDVLGLCPSGTCDKWTITVLLMRSADIGVGFLDLRAQLTADPSCCIEPHQKYYRYLGAGIGGGIDWTVNFNVGSAKFNTACIPWNAHNGFGRVSGVGAGIIITYGITYLTTPQAYVKISSPSWGLDLSDFTTVGRWWLE